MRIIAALLSSFALMACEPPPEPPAPEAVEQAESDYMSEPTEPSGSEGFVDTDTTPLTREELIGTWSIAQFCGQPFTFHEDGTLTDPARNTGRWRLEGDLLTTTINGRSFSNPVNQLNEIAFAAGPPNGLFIIYRRCS